MKDAKGNYIYEIIRGAIDAFDECMNDYLFVYAVREDLYYISPKATMLVLVLSFQQVFH